LKTQLAQAQENNNNNTVPASPQMTDDSNMFDIVMKRVDRIERRAALVLDKKPRVTLTGPGNFEAWRAQTIADASLMEADHILTHPKPQDADLMGEQEWKTLNDIYRSRIINSMVPSVKETFAINNTFTTHDLWNRVVAIYGKSSAKERLDAARHLKELHIKDNDYLQYEKEFRY
jgi:hypothetical protein